ncbi:hypothetical protein HYPSUDRAFT_58676 [Hypholoma sublateritium FD-334 SS-4]|uniref:Uncharacterized protein n=1 Tax=Hypholoma sublateritium (strain FD-334 SS-4) TaxID=945553 RepID=A0A0D2LXR3_HYPSF|nr:hypothetical protein HYPSUDRAFT_58676 [Hypholoma sublateritium FD-334 SS-4]
MPRWYAHSPSSHHPLPHPIQRLPPPSRSARNAVENLLDEEMKGYLYVPEVLILHSCVNPAAASAEAADDDYCERRTLNIIGQVVHTSRTNFWYTPIPRCAQDVPDVDSIDYIVVELHLHTDVIISSKSIWNVLDFLIKVGIDIVNVLWALRLTILMDKMLSTFQMLVISGALHILDAATFAILYIIPYAVWGLHIFNGYVKSAGLLNGISKHVNTEHDDIPISGSSHLGPPLAISAVSSSDSFRSSFLVLETVPLEGWTNDVRAATNVARSDVQL